MAPRAHRSSWNPGCKGLLWLLVVAALAAAALWPAGILICDIDLVGAALQNQSYSERAWVLCL